MYATRCSFSISSCADAVPQINLEVDSEPNQIYKMDFFAKIINGWKPLTIFAKIKLILDASLGSEKASSNQTEIYQRIWENNEKS